MEKKLDELKMSGSWYDKTNEEKDVDIKNLQEALEALNRISAITEKVLERKRRNENI
jgi:hypothetical protein